MNLVLDASFAVRALLEPDQPGLDVLEMANFIFAPDIFIAESSNTIWKYCEFGDLPVEDGEVLIDQLVALPDKIYSAADFYREAFALSVQHSHPICDMIYLCLARRENAILASLDKKLCKLAKKCKVKYTG